MARVSIIIEDVTGGAMDGSINLRLEADPPLPLDRDGNVVAENLSSAQFMALAASGFVEENYEVFSRNFEIEPLEDQ